MMYEELVQDFARRTRENLLTIRRLQEDGERVFEVTQLINSMLGLLVFPQQRFVDRIPETPLSELIADDWPVPRIIGNYPQAKNLRDLIRLLRNAIAHFNIEFLPSAQGYVDGLKIWNTEPREPYRTTWKAELSIAELEDITDRFIALILNEREPRA